MSDDSARTDSMTPESSTGAKGAPFTNTYYKGPVILRGPMIPTETTTGKLLASEDSTDWLHMDPWRVMRIQAEFVDGFGALTLLGLAGVATLVVVGITSGVLTSVASLREFVDGFGALAELGPAVSVFGSRAHRAPTLCTRRRARPANCLPPATSR